MLATIDHSSRLNRLCGHLPDGLDALLVTSQSHIRYLTGFAGSSGSLLVAASGAVLLTDGRYEEVASHLASQVDLLDVRIGTMADHAIAASELTSACRSVGLEADHVTWAFSRTIASGWFGASSVEPITGVVEAMRLVKDEAEIERIALAADITDAALASVRHMLAKQPTERQFQLALDRAILDGGADDLSFPTIVAGGPNASRPHHVPGDREIRDGDLVVVDVGALVDGYHSDMTRSFSIGEPDDVTRKMIEVTTAAQAAGVAAVEVGVTGEQVDVAARAVIEQAGFGDEFVHGVGHGVGLAIHEDPFLKGSLIPLVEGQVVTVEPGVYRSGFGGVRVEDTVVVTEGGCRPLTHSPKDPVVAIEA